MSVTLTYLEEAVHGTLVTGTFNVSTDSGGIADGGVARLTCGMRSISDAVWRTRPYGFEIAFAIFHGSTKAISVFQTKFSDEVFWQSDRRPPTPFLDSDFSHGYPSNPLMDDPK
jgi:hypothetical protein